MTVIRMENIMMPEFIEKSFDCSQIMDTTRFFMPAECFISEEDYYFEQEEYFTKTINYKSEQIFEKCERESKYNRDTHFENYFDISDIIPGEIAIEDEIKRGYLCKIY